MTLPIVFQCFPRALNRIYNTYSEEEPPLRSITRRPLELLTLVGQLIIEIYHLSPHTISLRAYQLDSTRRSLNHYGGCFPAALLHICSLCICTSVIRSSRQTPIAFTFRQANIIARQRCHHHYSLLIESAFPGESMGNNTANLQSALHLIRLSHFVRRRCRVVGLYPDPGKGAFFVRMLR